MGSPLPSAAGTTVGVAFTASFWWYYGYKVEGAV
jgi:hypothetical protein